MRTELVELLGVDGVTEVVDVAVCNVLQQLLLPPFLPQPQLPLSREEERGERREERGDKGEGASRSAKRT